MPVKTGSLCQVSRRLRLAGVSLLRWYDRRRSSRSCRDHRPAVVHKVSSWRRLDRVFPNHGMASDVWFIGSRSHKEAEGSEPPKFTLNLIAFLARLPQRGPAEILGIHDEALPAGPVVVGRTGDWPEATARGRAHSGVVGGRSARIRERRSGG